MKEKKKKPQIVFIPKGLGAHPLVNVYKGLVLRCCDPTNPKFHLYGGRGIKVAERWLGVDGFKNFLEDVGGSRPDETQTKKGRPVWTLERKDNNGPYSLENVMWATASQQNQNKRVSSLIKNTKPHPPRVRCYLVLVGQESILCRSDGQPWLSNDLAHAKHWARVHKGRVVGLKHFLDLRKVA